MKKPILFLIVVALIAIGALLYMIRPASAPSGTLSPSETSTTETPVADSALIFEIDATQSEAKFEIDEVLNNAPFHVVGTTRDVAGKIIIDVGNPSASSVGTISINARTIKTDSEMRDGMISRMILKSEENEFITFTPRSFSGLPATPAVGQEYTFSVTGLLVVAGTPKEVTFDVTAKANTETEIAGTATSKINYKDFAITIPTVSRVASVEDEVTLTFSFVAVKK